MNKEFDQGVDDVNQDDEQTIGNMNKDCEQVIDCAQTINATNHDHTYFLQLEEVDICDVHVDVHEEEADSASLPKTVVPVDTYRLVVKLGHIVKQLQQGCKKMQSSIKHL